MAHRRFTDALAGIAVAAARHAIADALAPTNPAAPSRPGRPAGRVGWLDPDLATIVVAQLAREHRLAPRAAELLLRSLTGVPRRYLAAEMGITEHTVKTWVKMLCRQTGHSTMDQVVWWARAKVVAAHPVAPPHR